MFQKTKIFKIIMTTNVILIILNNTSNFFISALSKEQNSSVQETKEDYFSALDGTTFNCFGIPLNIFSKALNKMFMDITKARDVRFYLFSRDRSRNVSVKPQYETIIADDDFNLKEINFRIERKTVVIVHGFLASGQDEWLHEMKNALLRQTDVNVIIVDWQSGSNTWNYYAASLHTQIVGTQIARFFDKLKNKALLANPRLRSVGSLHFIGHSLGSHISAHASYRIQQNDRDKVIKWILERITGLDPAQPCFQTANLTLKLNKGDAVFIDAIHTNARSIMLLGLGLPDELGDIDYYPNGGQVQLGCDDIDTSMWRFLKFPSYVVKRAICSHGRSHELFTDSIIVKMSKKCSYIGKSWNRTYENLNELVNEKCLENTCPEMGINAVKYYQKASGSYFVSTSNVSHFCDVTEENKKAILTQLNQDKGLSENIFFNSVRTVFG